MTGVWDLVQPQQVLDARLRAADCALRRLCGDLLDAPGVTEAVGLVQDAVEACRPEGRPLYAAHAQLPWPDEPHLALWHGITLLREHRGDGHIAALVADGITGIEANVLHAATGIVPARFLRGSRAWTKEEWAAASDRLVARGWVAEDGSFTDAGQVHREGVEELTDRLAVEPWQRLGEERAQRLRELVRPLTRAVVDGGGFGPVARRDPPD